MPREKFSSVFRCRCCFRSDTRGDILQRTVGWAERAGSLRSVNDYMCKKINRLGFASLLISGCLLAFSSGISAQRDDGPPAHNFGGTWSLRQSNGFVVTMKLKQNGREITGTATANARNGVSTGVVTGRAWQTKGTSGWQSNVDHFQVEIAWNGPVGVYQASASWAEGRLNGATYQKDKPSARANWSAGPFARRRGNAQ